MNLIKKRWFLSEGVLEKFINDLLNITAAFFTILLWLMGFAFFFHMFTPNSWHWLSYEQIFGCACFFIGWRLLSLK